MKSSGYKALNMIQKLILFGRMIRFSHTVFALPFALSAMLLGHRQRPITLQTAIFILLAMIGARSAAMGFNRLADAEIDAQNPRTFNRAIPAGLLTKKTVAIFVVVSSLLFLFSASLINPLCMALSLPVLLFLFSYSYTKRFTWLSHLYLGLTIGLAPIGAWIAVTGSVSYSIFILAFALVTYIAGFDILYACQDIEFDKTRGLCSIPARWGIRSSLRISSMLHILSFILLVFIYPVFGMGIIYLISAGIIGVLFLVEHRLVNPNDLSRVNMAFFHVNSLISVMFFIGILLDELTRGCS
ncbi:MAG: UbiA-like polyprenyltransferase [Pseudomonadota bacterium]